MTEVEIEKVRNIASEVVQEAEKSVYYYPIRGAFEIFLDRIEEAGQQADDPGN